MTEEGIDTGGKAGMSRKLVAGIIVAVVVIASIGAYVFLTDGGGSTYPNHFELFWDTEYTETAWLVKVVDIRHSPPGHQTQLRTGELLYGITNKETWEHLEGYALSEIINETSPLGFTWMDVNNNGIVEAGDYLRINKSGGIGGMINPDRDELVIAETGRTVFVYPSNVVHLPPAEFLEMDVVKTATGWNMTVTWVNGTVPRHFLEDGNISFRLENRSGEFFTTRDKEYSVEKHHTFGLWLIDDIRGEYDRFDYNDMGFYNITWYDNDKNGGLSVNDTFLIDNYDDLIEPGFKFRLICEKYGWVHTIHELTFE